MCIIIHIKYINSTPIIHLLYINVALLFNEISINRYLIYVSACMVEIGLDVGFVCSA